MFLYLKQWRRALRNWQIGQNSKVIRKLNNKYIILIRICTLVINIIANYSPRC